MRTFLAAVVAALALPASAVAHAEISPSLGFEDKLELYTLAVPTDREDATTTTIEVTVPSGFGIDSFAPAPGWKREVQRTGTGEEAVIQKVIWSGGAVSSGEVAAFSFLASASEAKTYAFPVRQTYADGTVVHWNGAESSDKPSPTIAVLPSIGTRGRSTLAVVGVAAGAAGVVLAIARRFSSKRSSA